MTPCRGSFADITRSRFGLRSKWVAEAGLLCDKPSCEVNLYLSGENKLVNNGLAPPNLNKPSVLTKHRCFMKYKSGPLFIFLTFSLQQFKPSISSSSNSYMRALINWLVVVTLTLVLSCGELRKYLS